MPTSWSEGIMEGKAVDFLKKILQIPSVSGNEQELSRFLKGFVESHGFTLIDSSLDNVIATKGQGKPVLLMASHMDTVPTNNPYRTEEGKIFAPGAVDCKPSLAAMFWAAAHVEWKPEWGTLVLAAVVEEEISTRGMKDYFLHGPKPDYAIFGEPTNYNQICIGYKGRVLFRMQTECMSGHVACCWQYDNAIAVCMDIFGLLQKDFEVFNQSVKKPAEHYFHRITPNLVKVQGGTNPNSLPNSCEMMIDIRIPPEIDAEELKQQIIQRIIDYQSSHCEHPETQISYEFPSCFNATETPLNALVLAALKGSIYKQTKAKATLVKKTGSTFTNLIADHYQIPVATYGPGDPKLEHCNDECIEINEYLQVIEIYHQFFERLHVIHQRKQAKQR